MTMSELKAYFSTALASQRKTTVLTMGTVYQTEASEHAESYPVCQHHEHEERFHLDSKS